MIRQSLIWSALLAAGAGVGWAQESPPDAGAATSNGARVSAVLLFAEWREGETGRWRELRLGQALPPGSHVRTLKRSSLEVRFSDESYIRLAPETTLVLLKDDRKVVLRHGLIYGDYRNPGEVQVPSQDLVVQIPGNRFLVGTKDATTRPPMVFSGEGATVTTGGSSLPLPASPGSEPFPYGEKDPFYQEYPTGLQTTAVPETTRTAIERVISDNLIQSTVADPLTPTIPTTDQTQPPLRPVLEPPDPPEFSPESRKAETSRPGYFGPEFDGSVFAFQSSEDTLAGAYLREYGTLAGRFWEVAVTPVQLFGGDNDIALTDANVRVPTTSGGEFTFGRQRFLTGAVQNTRIGTLIRQGGRDIQDAVTFRSPLSDGRAELQLSYLVDAFPSGLPTAVPGLQWGWYTRLGYQMNVGHYGLNVTQNELGDQIGATLDFSLPVFRKHLEVYGEVGQDTFGRGIRTAGVYFPRLYQKYDVDLFLEYSDMGDFGLPYSSEYLLRVYYPLSQRVYGFTAVDGRSGDDTEYGFGLVVRLTGSR